MKRDDNFTFFPDPVDFTLGAGANGSFELRVTAAVEPAVNETFTKSVWVIARSRLSSGIQVQEPIEVQVKG
jgi:hypothetical protein